MAAKQHSTFVWDGKVYGLKFNPDDRRHEVRLPDGTLVQGQWTKVGDDPWEFNPTIKLDPHDAVEV